MLSPLNASGEGSPHTVNGVSNPMQQFQGTCACTHMYQWNHTCPPSNTTNGTSGTFSPHSKWTYYLAVPTTLPPPPLPVLHCRRGLMGPSPHSTTTSLPHSKPMEPLTPTLQVNLIISHFKSSQKCCTTSGATSPSTYGVIRPFTASRGASSCTQPGSMGPP